MVPCPTCDGPSLGQNSGAKVPKKQKGPGAEEPPGPLQRSLRPRLHKINYDLFGSDEEDPNDTKLPSITQGYICVSADPRRAGTAMGGESFILTTEELKMLLKEQGQSEDQQVWLTTAQAGFPTVPK